MPYQKIGELVATLESSKVIMRVTSLHISKGNQIGVNKVSFEIATLITRKWEGM